MNYCVDGLSSSVPVSQSVTFLKDYFLAFLKICLLSHSLMGHSHHPMLEGYKHSLQVPPVMSPAYYCMSATTGIFIIETCGFSCLPLHVFKMLTLSYCLPGGATLSNIFTVSCDEPWPSPLGPVDTTN